MVISPRRARGCVSVAVVTALVGLAGPATAAWAAPPPSSVSRSHGHVLGDGLHAGLGFADQPADPLAGQVCADGETLFGIDVSIYQGDIDWPAVAASGVKFAWIRVSHSTSFEDPKFAANFAGARAAGVHAGVYQYFEPSEDPIAQAQLLLDLMGPLQPGDMPPMIDVESANTVPQAAYIEAVRAWLDHVEAATGTVPFIYTGYYYWKDNLGPTAEFVDHPLWIANYNPGCPLVPDAWPTWTAHQYCDCGDVPGIEGNVDVNHFNGGMDKLLGHSVGAAVCGDGSCGPGEDAYACAEDCPPCGIIPAEGGVIDDGEPCHQLLGDPLYWRHEAAGHGGTLVWTNVTEYAEAANSAVWRMYFAESGTYALDVWVEQPFGETRQATYRVHHAGGEMAVPVDQSLASGWVPLGEFSFDAATDHFVRVDDNTGEMNTLELSLTADALRITRIGGGDDTTSDTSTLTTSGGDATTDAPTSGGPPGDDTTGAAPGPTTTAEPPGGTSESSGDDGPPADIDGDEGCGCRGGQPSGAGALLFGLLALRRRRRA